MEPLDPQAVALSKAIRQQESGGNFNARSKDGSYGAYQFIKPTWDTTSKKFGVTAEWDKATPEQQNEVAYKQIKEWKDKGYNVGQIASMWNAGAGKPNAYKSNLEGTNKDGVKYNVAKYAEKVATLYQGYKNGGDVSQETQGTDLSQLQPATVQEQKSNLEAQGQPVSTQDNRAEPTFGGSIFRGILKPFARLGTNAVNLAQTTAGLFNANKGQNTTPFSGKYLGDVQPIGMQENTGAALKDILGSGAEIASNFIGGEGTGSIIKTGTKGFIKSAAKEGLITGATTGALQGSGSALQKDKGVGGTLLDTGIGALTGGITGGIIGGTSGAIGAGVRSATGTVLPPENKVLNNIVSKRVSELQKLEDNNASVRKVISNAQSKGFDLKNILSSTDLLHGSVDNTGTIRTQDAISELNDFIKSGPEKVISTNLAKEGVTIPLSKVEKEMVDAVNKSSLTGSSKITALNGVKKEIAGLRLDTDKTGNISLSKIHDAKVNKYANVNYLNPETGTSDKLIAKTLKDLVEKNTKSIDVKKLNNELSQHYAIQNLLEKLDGKKVMGGKLGKYFAQTVGGMVGSHFGPLGTIVGSELGGRIRGSQLSSKFGQKLGKNLESSQAMKDAIVNGLDQSSKSLGNRKINQSTTMTPTKKGISPLLQQKNALSKKLSPL